MIVSESYRGLEDPNMDWLLYSIKMVVAVIVILLFLACVAAAKPYCATNHIRPNCIARPGVVAPLPTPRPDTKKPRRRVAPPSRG